MADRPFENTQFTDMDNTEVNNGMFNQGSGYGINSASDMSLGFVDDILDPTGFVKGFYNDMMGFTSQEREFEQQMLATKSQNEWNSAQQQMKRAKAAGINPLTAAGGIAGNGTGSVAGAAGSATPSTAVADSIRSLGTMHADTALSDAEAQNQRSQASKNNAELPWIPTLSHGQYMQMYGNFIQSMKDVGLSEIQSGGIAFDIMSGGLTKAIEYLSLCSGLRNIDAQIKNVKIQYDLANKDLESYDLRLNSNLSLQEKQGLQAAAAAAKMKAETTFQNQINDLNNQLPGITLGGSSFIAGLAWKKGVDSPEFKALEQGIYNYAYQNSLGSFDADIDTAFSRFYNQAKAKSDVDAAFAPYMKKIEVMGDSLKEFARAMLENPSSIEGAIATFMNKIFVALYGTQVNFDAVNSATTPTPGNADRSNRGN